MSSAALPGVAPALELSGDPSGSLLAHSTLPAWPAVSGLTAVEAANLESYLVPTTNGGSSPALAPAQSAPAKSAEIGSGLAQLDRYLNKTWFRAGIAPQQHADCTQAVYVTLLQNLGRDRFDRLMSQIGQTGIRDVLSQETPEGPDFFRAVDTIKKRAQRERTFQPLDSAEILSNTSTSADSASLRSALDEAISQSLSPREAALIQATLKGETPTEIASKLGIAPKTVSNEKTKAIQKLRGALGSPV